MELKPEIYAWLLSTNIVDLKNKFSIKENGNVMLPTSFVDTLIDCKPIVSLIEHIDELYSRFYKMSFNYKDRLSMIVAGSAHSVRFKNWSIVVEVLANYGLEIGEDKIYQIANNSNVDTMKELLGKLYNLTQELQSRGRDDRPKVEESQPLESSLVTRKLNNNDSIDITNIDPKTDLDNLNNILEFFIVSICRYLELKPRQAAGLLSDNRKYLLQVVTRGIKNDYSKILKWYQELAISVRRMNDCIKNSKNRELSKKTTIKICSCGMFSSQEEIAKISFNLVAELQSLFGTDWSWFIKEGIEGFLNIINRFDDQRVAVLNLMIEMQRTRERGLDEILEYIFSKSPQAIFMFFFAIVRKLKQVSFVIYDDLKFKLLDYCLKEKDHVMASISLIAEAMIHLRPLEEGITKSLIGKFKRIIKEEVSAYPKMYSFIKLFVIVKSLSDEKDKLAHTIYQLMIFMFVENYSNFEIKKLFLDEMLFNFNTDSSLSTDIFMNLYIKNLKKTSDISIEDFNFINAMLFHKQMKQDMLVELLKIMANITLTSPKYFQLAHLLFNKILDREIISSELIQYLISYTFSAFKIFMKDYNQLYLIIPYEIMLRDLPLFKGQIEPEVIKSLMTIRQEKGVLNSALMKFLWKMGCHDELLLKIEEKFAKKYKASEFKVIEKPKLKNLTDEIKHGENKEITKISKFDKMSAQNIINQILQEKMVHELDKANQAIRQEEKEKKQRESLQKKQDIDAILKGKKKGDVTSLLILKENTIDRNMTRYEKENMKLPHVVDLSLEEPREARAVEILSREYSKSIKYFHYQYVTNIDDTITKSKILQFFRDLGYNNYKLTIEELTFLIRELFTTRKTNFVYEEFKQILQQISYFIISKQDPSVSFHEAYSQVLKKMIVPQASKIDKELIRYFESLPNHENYVAPIGYKKKKMVKLSMDNCIAKPLRAVLGEPKSIVLELINEITLSCLKMPILEGKVREEVKYTLVPSLNKPKWKKDLLKNVLTLDKRYSDVVFDVGQVMEELLSAVEDNRNSLEKPHLVHPRLAEQVGMQVDFLLSEEKKKKIRDENKQRLKERIDDYKQKKKEEEYQKRATEKDALKKIKEAREIEKKANEERKEKVKEYQDRKAAIEQEKLEKLKKKEDKKKEKLQVNQERVVKFFSKRRAEIKELKPKLRRISSNEEKKMRGKSSKTKREEELEQKVLKGIDQNKEYRAFEKEMNSYLLKLLDKPGLKQLFESYALHNRFIYDTYCLRAVEMGVLENYLKYDQFKEFSLHFSILGMLINNEQIRFIYSKASSVKNKEINVASLSYQEFLLTMLYFIVFSNSNNKTLRIKESDIDAVDEEAVSSFFEFLSFDLPFDKQEMISIYHDKQLISAKERHLKMKEFKWKKNEAVSEKQEMEMISPKGGKETWEVK